MLHCSRRQGACLADPTDFVTASAGRTFVHEVELILFVLLGTWCMLRHGRRACLQRASSCGLCEGETRGRDRRMKRQQKQGRALELARRVRRKNHQVLGLKA